MAAKKKKNSLVENINARKRAGKSRPKSRSTVSSEAYERMEEGWPKQGAAKKTGKRAKKSAAAKKSSAKKSSAKKSSAKKTAKKTAKKATSARKKGAA
jgi:hypothetical protein